MWNDELIRVIHSCTRRQATVLPELATRHAVGLTSFVAYRCIENR